MASSGPNSQIYTHDNNSFENGGDDDLVFIVFNILILTGSPLTKSDSADIPFFLKTFIPNMVSMFFSKCASFGLISLIYLFGVLL